VVPTGRKVIPYQVYTSSSGEKYTRGNKSPYVVFGKSYEVLPDSLGFLEIGLASWYGKKFHGRLTSSGETYDMYKLSAAHKSLPLPTIVKVTNLDNGEYVILKVNDRGPFHSDRVIDLSFETAVRLGFAKQGTAPVVVEALDEVNYPELYLSEGKTKSVYLQAGAFTQLRGAEKLSHQIDQLMMDNAMASIPVSIHQSEKATRVLHKVLLGPIPEGGERERILNIFRQADLGTPLQVEVD
jgi:rare lipoprotein A